VTFTVFGLPNVKDPAWNTSSVGNYARLGLASFTFSAPSGWKEVSQSFSGDYFLQKDGIAVSESAVTTVSWPANTPFFINGFNFNPSNLRYVLCECGWNTTADGLTGVSLRFWSDDDVEVYKDGVYLDTYKIGGQTAQATQAQGFSGVMLLPCRKRELLVVSTLGTGFTHVFHDLDEDDDEPVVTSASPFWIKFPVASSARSVSFQVARIQTASSCTAVSRMLSFPDAPELSMAESTPITYADLYGGTTVVSLLNEAGTGVFVRDGTNLRCRVKIVMTTAGVKMSGFYGATMGFDPLVQPTADAVFDIVPYVHECHLRVTESAAASTLTLTMGRIDEMDLAWQVANDGDFKIKTQSNRPLKAKFADSLLMGGRTGQPKLVRGFDDSVDTIEIEVRDRWQALETYIFRDVVPLDGMLFTDAIKLIVRTVIGDAPERYDIESTVFRVQTGASQSEGAWGFLIEAGDRAADALTRLIDAYAADWFYGFVPTAAGTVFRARSAATLDSNPAVELSLTADDAYLRLVEEGYSPLQAVKLVQYRVCRSYRQDTLPIEATEVRLLGTDKRTGEPIMAYKVVDELEDPTVLVGDRVDGWWGEKKTVVYYEPSLSTQKVLEAATKLFANRLTVPRTIAEWECGMLFHSDGAPVWRGDTVRITDIGDFRITSFEANLAKEPDEESEDPMAEWSHRPTTYTGELIVAASDGIRGRTRGAGIDEISMMTKLQSGQSQMATLGIERLRQMAPLRIYKV